MEIKTKFNPGDTVFTIHDSKIKQMIVHDIDVFLNSDLEITVRYNLNFNKTHSGVFVGRRWHFEAYNVLEQKLYRTKADLINNL